MDRSYYLSDFADEVVPCDPTLDGWAKWLAAGGDAEWPVEKPADGAVFLGSAIAWQPDIIGTRSGGEWSLSRDPGEDDFVAVRYSEGSGWAPDNIIYPGSNFTEHGFVPAQTMREALLAFLSDETEQCDDTEYVAVGDHESGWRFTYRADPPRLEAERSQ